MRHSTILLGVCLLLLCTAPVHALFAGDDFISMEWCPFGAIGHGIENNILWNDIPNTLPVKPILFEDAKYGHVEILPDGRVGYGPYSDQWDINHAMDSFRYRTFDGIEYSNDATVYIGLFPHLPTHDGEELKFSTPKDTMLSAQILDDLDWVYDYRMEAWYSIPDHGTLLNWETSYADDWTKTPYFHYIPDPGFEGIDHIEYRMSVDSGECGYMFGMPGTIEITVGNPSPVPEFPSAVLPAIFVIGFLGAVLLIRRTREN